MNNLLVGGTGFIGSALGRELITRGERVVSVSHFGKGNSDGVESIEVDLYRENCPNEIFEQADNVFILVGQIRTGFDPAAECF